LQEANIHDFLLDILNYKLGQHISPCEYSTILIYHLICTSLSSYVTSGGYKVKSIMGVCILKLRWSKLINLRLSLTLVGLGVDKC